MTKRAVVLGGGGSRGPYQIGVWRALRELDLSIDIVTGSSVGTLNGAFIVQGNYEEAKAMWESLTIHDVIADAPDPEVLASRTALLNFMRKSIAHGGMDVSPLEEKVRQTVNEEALRNSPIQFGIVTARYPFMRPVQVVKEDIPEGELVDYMLASASWFPFFRRRTIDGVDYIDGAYADNLPAELAAKCGATEIVAIDLQGTGIVHAFREDIPIRHIRSHWNLGDMLIFDPETARRNMQLGYQDGMKAFRKLEGNAYAFALGDARANVLRLRGALDAIHHRVGVSLFRQRDMLPRLQETLRYRSIDRRFLPAQTSGFTMGHAVTSAAELTGELLQVPPDRVYRLRQFNKLLIEATGLLHEPGEEGSFFLGDSPQAKQMRLRSRTALRTLLQMLRQGYAGGSLPEAFWGVAAISPVEFVAANYLLALELHYKRIG